MRLLSLALTLLIALLPATLIAAPPYDVTVTFNAPTTGGAPDGYSLYVDDCAVSGATGAAVGAVVSGQTFNGLLTADGTYEICVRAFNAAGEQPDPGPVATVTVSDLPLPGPIENLDIQIGCPNGSCTVEISIAQ